MPLLASADEKKRRAKINQIKHAKITKKEKQRNKTSRVNKQENWSKMSRQYEMQACLCHSLASLSEGLNYSEKKKNNPQKRDQKI